MLACHDSQSSWLEDQYQMNYTEFSFQASPAWPKLPTPLLLL